MNPLFASMLKDGASVTLDALVGLCKAKLESVAAEPDPGQDPRAETAPEYQIACEFLDLPTTGSFAWDDLKRKVRELRVLYHPDGKPAHEFHRCTKISQRIAWAEHVIAAHKGWIGRH